MGLRGTAGLLKDHCFSGMEGRVIRRARGDLRKIDGGDLFRFAERFTCLGDVECRFRYHKSIPSRRSSDIRPVRSL